MSHASFTFGRFNPPTESGHGKLVSAVQAHAEEHGGQHYIFPSHTQDKKKNPLSHGDKVHAMKKMFKGANIASHEGVHTAIDAMKHLEKKGHTHVTMVVGSDRVPQFHKLLNDYNGKEYNFKKINVVSAGHRDPDAEGAEGMSASKMRGLVKSGKRDEFISHYSDKKLGAHLHDKVKQAMSESVKAIFIVGGPGSGKDYVINNILNRFDLVEVQLDQIIVGSAKELIESQQNLLINAPADLAKIELVKNTLGEDYDFSYTLVSVTNKVSRERNESRGKPMNESVRIRKWLDAEQTAKTFEDTFVFNNSINLNEANQSDLITFQQQIADYLGFLVNEGFIMVEKKFPPVAKDKESGLPKKYVAGLSTATAKARAAHWKEKSKLSDSDPRAYEPAPGDATAETKPSKHTLAVRKMMKSEACWTGYTAKGMKKKGNKMVPNCVPVSEDSDNSIEAKAKKSGISVGTLKAVYRRGVAAWNSGHRPGTTPQQWGHARVNSYINKGKTYHTADKDLREENNSGDVKVGEVVGFRHHGLGDNIYGKVVSVEADHVKMKSNSKTYAVPHHLVIRGHNVPSYRYEEVQNEAASVSWYPRKGFPEQGEYGYDPNPGLEPQESDKDADMDVAYKKYNEKDAPKLPNTRILERPNKIEVTKKTKNEAFADVNIETKPSLEGPTKVKYKKKLVPPNDINSRIDGAGGYSLGGLTQTEETDMLKFKEFVNEATHQGREVPLNKPMKGDVKKSKVYVRDPSTGNIKKVNFGDKKLSIKSHIPERKKSYCARSGGQGNLTDKTKANYWSRRAWKC